MLRNRKPNTDLIDVLVADWLTDWLIGLPQTVDKQSNLSKQSFQFICFSGYLVIDLGIPKELPP